MGRTIKYIIGIISVITILLLVIPFFISLDTYKNIIENQAKKHTGRNFKIDGEISLSILPSPQIKLARIKLPSLPNAKNPYLLEVEGIEASLALLPLLKGQIIVSSLKLIKPIINLETLKNGKHTWEFTTIKQAEDTNTALAHKTPNKQPNISSKASLPFIINDINIQNGKLHYIDMGKITSVDDFDLSIFIANVFENADYALGHFNAFQSDGEQWSHKKIDLSFLRKANAVTSLRIHKLIMNKTVLENIKMKSELLDGTLKISSLTGSLDGGKFEGSGSLSSKNNNPMILKLSLQDANISNITPEAHHIKIIGGKVNFNCDLNSYGTSQFEYIKNIHGSITLRGKDGRVSGVDLPKIIHALENPKDLRVLSQGLEEGINRGETFFSTLKSDISIDKGIMHIINGEIVSNNTSATIEGKLNLPQFTIDVLTTINSGIKNLPPVPIYFYGSLSHPSRKINIKSIWENFAQETLKNKIDSLTQGKIKLKDVLKW